MKRIRQSVIDRFRIGAIALASVIVASSSGIALIAGLGLMPTPVYAEPAAEGEGIDILIFRNGDMLKGKILDETETEVVFEGEIHGIPLKTTFSKVDLISIRHNQVDEDANPSANPNMASSSIPKSTGTPDKPRNTSSDATSIYVLTLEGEFSTEIHVQPIRRALADAKKYEPDYIVLVVDNAWVDPTLDDSDTVTTVSGFDQLFYAEQIEPLFTNEIRDSWAKQPEIVIWVKNAMGGAAFLPFLSSEMYFHPDGRIGGIGQIEEFFQGDDFFNEKQISLRLGHAEGMFIARGYEPKLVRAFARTPYVLSYKLEGGEPVYIEAMPSSSDEVLLTDDGDSNNADTVQQVVRRETNDVLTLYAEPARQINVSKGTVSTLEELIFELGVARNYKIVEGQSERIMQNWSRGLDAARRELPRMWRDYNDIGNNNNDQSAKRTRGRQISKLKEVIRLIRKFDGALKPQQFGIPPVPELEALIAQIRLQNLGDVD